MAIFQYQDYKKFVLDRVKSYPAGGHGVFRKISEAFSIPPSTLSLVFKGERDLTAEQAVDIADFFALSELETEYFMLLVDKSRAGNPRLRKFVDGKLARVRRQADNLANRVAPERRSLGPAEKATFYSEWYYSAIRLLTSLKEFRHPSSISKQLGLPVGTVQKALAFLEGCGLVVEKNGSYSMGEGSTYVGPDDPLAFRHLQNWHQKAVHRLHERPSLEENELCISIPCATSEEAIRAIKQELLDAMVKVTRHIEAGKEEKVVYLNLDFLEARRGG